MIYLRDIHKLGPVGTNQVLQYVHGIFKEYDKVHALPAVDTTQQREERTNHPRGPVATDTEDSDSEDEYSMMPPLIYLE